MLVRVKPPLCVSADVHTEAVQAALAKHKERKMAVPMPSKRRSLVVQTSMDAYTPPGMENTVTATLRGHVDVAPECRGHEEVYSVLQWCLGRWFVTGCFLVKVRTQKNQTAGFLLVTRFSSHSLTSQPSRQLLWHLWWTFGARLRRISLVFKCPLDSSSGRFSSL